MILVDCVDWIQRCDNPLHNCVSVVYLLGWVQDPQLCWCWWAYVHWVDDRSPLLVDTASHVSFLNYSFHSISRPLSVSKHLTQMCGFITLAKLQTFYQMSNFNRKTHYLQTCKYDVRMTSSVEWIINFDIYGMNTSFFINIPWKFWVNPNFFQGNIEENVSACFLTNPGTSATVLNFV